MALSWIVFRAEDNTLLGEFFGALLRFDAPLSLTPGIVLAVCMIAGGLAAQLLGERFPLRESFLSLPLPVKASAYAAVATLVTVFGAAGGSSFIYFQF